MARETKVIQCHPDNENSEISWHEMFGWEVISNQRCQEEQKRGDNWYTVTFNKITFSREKSAPWYDRVCELEEEANYLVKYGIKAINGEAFGIKEPKKVKKPLIARRSGFFWGLFFVLQYGLYNALNFLSPELSMLNLNSSGLIGAASCILFIVGLVKVFKNIKNLKGLSGAAAKEAIEKYNKYQEDYKEYANKLKEICDQRREEILAELIELIK